MLGFDMAPLGEWIFVGTSIDSVARKHYGFRYYTKTGAIVYQRFVNRTDNFYTLNYSNSQINIGGVADKESYGEGHIFANCYCYLQYFRFFMDYTPSTTDEFRNLALMDPTSNLFIRKQI